MKNSLIVLLLLVLFMNASSQVDSVDVYQKPASPFLFTVETGTVYTSVKNYGGMGSFFMTPEIKIHATPKLNLYFSSTLQKNTYGSFMNNAESSVYNNSAGKQYVSLMAEGEYKFNRKLHVKGSIYKSNGSNSFLYGYRGINSMFYLEPESAYSIGVFYQITKNIEIGAEFRHMNYSQPYFPDF